MSDLNALRRVQPDDPEYLVMARAEAAFWHGRKGLMDVAALPAEAARLHNNRRFTGDENEPWFESIARYGTFTEGAILGAGGMPQESRILETNPALSLTVFDISAGPLADREHRFGSVFAGRVQTCLADLNFIDLPEQSYDVIVSASAIHHVINLEYLAAQVQRSLRPGGYFFLYDYVGESKRRFAPEKKLVYELVYNRDLVRQGRRPTVLGWTDGDAESSPFCTIRSADILPVFREYLHEQEVRTTGALMFPLLFARDRELGASLPLRWRLMSLPGTRKIQRILRQRFGKRANALLDPAFIQRLLDTGDRLADVGQLLPSTAFAIYRKRI